MRISDWSSDVCSSDLLVVPRGGGGAGLGQHGGAVAGDQEAVRQGEEGRVGVVGSGAPAMQEVGRRQAGFQPLRHRRRGARAGGRPAIGRASCRDRVCRYVYISVVADELKKKKKQSKMKKERRTKK